MIFSVCEYIRSGVRQPGNIRLVESEVHAFFSQRIGQGGQGLRILIGHGFRLFEGHMATQAWGFVHMGMRACDRSFDARRPARKWGAQGRGGVWGAMLPTLLKKVSPCNRQSSGALIGKRHPVYGCFYAPDSRRISSTRV